MEKYKISPTIKQKKVFQEVMKGSSFRKAMIKAGYSIESATNPKNVVNSIGWKQLIETAIPDDLLMRIHLEGLIQKDYSIRHRYLDTAYKIKGKYPKDGINTAFQINFRDNDLINIDEVRKKYT